MKQKIFCALALMAVFAVFTFGGCGGSDTSNISSSFPAQTSTTVQKSMSASEMVSVMSGDKFSTMWNELTESGVIQKLGDWYLIYNISEDAQARILAQVSGEEREQIAESFFDAARVKAKYDAGEVVAIAYPDQAIINKVLQAAGEKPNYAMDQTTASGHLEIFAIAKETVDSQDHTFVYIVPKLSDIVAQVLDILPVSADADESFQVNRWREFFTWAAERSDAAKENALTASEFTVKAAAADSITTVGGSHTITLNRSRTGKVEGVTLNGGGKRLGGEFVPELNWTYDLSARLTYRTFAVHSFTNGKDYYLVRANVRTQPRSVLNNVRSFSALNGSMTLQTEELAGYFKGYSLATYINASDTHANTSPSMTEALLIDYMPSVNISQNSQYSDNILWDESGTFTAGTKGVTINGLTYGRNQTWQTSDYSITDDSMAEADHHEKTYWTVEMAVPDATSSGLVAKPASTNAYTENFEWLWEVDKSFWQPRTRIGMYVKFSPRLGVTLLPVGEAEAFFARTDEYKEPSSSQGVTLKEPPHVAVSQKEYILAQSGGQNAGFQVYSESDWTVSSDVDWINLVETSGKATGEAPHWLYFNASDNTTGAVRKGTITLTANTRSNEKNTVYKEVLPETIAIQVTQLAN